LLTLELQDLEADGFDISLTGFDDLELSDFFGSTEGNDGGEGAEKSSGVLAATFGVPPFSVLNAREGWWQERKQAWTALGIQSELGRGEGPEASPGGSLMPSATLGDDGKTLRGDGRGRRANAIPGG
jgi:hypothetical protein